MELNMFSSLVLILYLFFSFFFFFSFPFVTPQIIPSIVNLSRETLLNENLDLTPKTITPSSVNPGLRRVLIDDVNSSPKSSLTSVLPADAKNLMSKTKLPSASAISSTVQSIPVTCSVDATKLNICVDLLGGLITSNIGGSVENEPCCPLIQGILGLEVSACVCTIVKSNPLGALHLNILLNLLLKICGLKPSPDFECV